MPVDANKNKISLWETGPVVGLLEIFQEAAEKVQDHVVEDAAVGQ
jgi:hypothetical protein